MERRKIADLTAERFVAWWVGAKNIRPTVQGAVLLSWLFVLCAVTFAVGVPRLRIFGHDVFVPLEGAWRVLNGQRPSVDFYGVKGPLWYVLNAAGLGLAHGAALGLGYTSTIVAILLSAWTYLALRRRLETIPLFLACSCLVLLAIAPFPLGEFPYQTSLSMTYNRYGYAFTGLVLLECFLPSSEEDKRSTLFGGGFSSGLACAFVIFTKVSFGLVALVLVGISVFLRPRERLRIGGLAAGFVLFTLPMLAYLRFDLPEMIHEYRIAAAVRGRGVDISAFAKACYQGRYEIGVVLVLALGVTLLPGVAVRRRFALALAIAAITIADLLLRITNAQIGDLPLIAVAAVLLMNEVTLALQRRDTATPTMHAATLLCLGLLSAGMRITPDAIGLAGALLDPVLRPRPGYRFKEPQLAALEFFDLKDPNGEHDIHDNDNGERFVRYTEEGIDLARAHSGPSESVRGMGNSTPFSYAMLRPPSRGGANDINVTDVSAKLVPPPGMLIGDVDLILIPHYLASERVTMAIVLSAYNKYLASKYLIAGTSANWVLLRKRELAEQRSDH